MVSTRDLWLEYKVAKQYSELWGRVEENIHLVQRLEAADRLPNQDDLASVVVTSPGSASPAYWMTQVDVPTWFRNEELGRGGTIDIWRTLASLGATNKRRAKQYEAEQKNLTAGRVAGHSKRISKKAA
jgi:hypothetical protein